MARRKRNILAKNNKGKLGQVVFHNWLVAQSDKKKKKVERERKQVSYEKKIKSDCRKLELEVEKSRRQRLRRESLEQRKYENELREEKKANEKYQKYENKAGLICDEFNIDHICIGSIVDVAFSAGVSLGNLRNEVVKNRLDYWKEKEVELLEEQYTEEVQEICSELVSKGKIYKEYLDDLVEAICEEQVDSEDIADSEILDHFIIKSKSRSLIIQELNNNTIHSYFVSQIFDEFEELTSQDNSFDVKNLLSEYTKKTALLNAAYDVIKKKEILEEYLADFRESVLEEDPAIESFYACNAYQEYSKKTQSRIKQVDDRLAKHMVKNSFF